MNYILTLDSEAFNALKSDFNQMLRKTLTTMLQKEGEVADVKITLKITLVKMDTPEGDEGEPGRELIIPKFEHKITAQMAYKDEKSGSVGGIDYELVFDKDKGEYIMRKIKGAQRSLFDQDDDESGYEYEGQS